MAATLTSFAKTPVQTQIESLARKIGRRKAVKAALTADGTYGDLLAALGIDSADDRRLDRLTAHQSSALHVMAWVELGRPEWEVYTECDAADVPAGVRFDTPRRNQGQIVTYSYGTTGRGEAGYGDPYMMRHDASDGEVTHYRLTWIA